VFAGLRPLGRSPIVCAGSRSHPLNEDDAAAATGTLILSWAAVRSTMDVLSGLGPFRPQPRQTLRG